MHRCCHPWWYQTPSLDGDTLIDHTSRSAVQLHKKQYFEAVFWYSNAPAWYCGILIFWPRILVFWLLRPDTKVAFLSAVAPPAVDCMTWEVAFGKLIPYLFKTDSAARAWEQNLRGKWEGERPLSLESGLKKYKSAAQKSWLQLKQNCNSWMRVALN